MRTYTYAWIGSVLTSWIIMKVMSIDCFICNSYNSSDQYCDDPFHPAFGHYVRKCRQQQDGRFGLFPAKYCTKIKGLSIVDGTELVIRSCALKNLDSVCGIFKFESTSYNGCMMSCKGDACNSTLKTKTAVHLTVAFALTLVLLLNHVGI